MAAWLRRRRLPAEAVAWLDRDERVTAWAELAGGGVAVATVRGLWLLDWNGPDGGGLDRGGLDRGGPDGKGGPGELGPRRIGWHLVARAGWQPPTLTVVEAVEEAELGGARVLRELPARALRLPVPRDLPGEVRERVGRSVRHTERHELAPGGEVRVVARRVAGRDGLAWQLRFDAGTDPEDPLVREQAARLLAAARDRLAPPG